MIGEALRKTARLSSPVVWAQRRSDPRSAPESAGNLAHAYEQVLSHVHKYAAKPEHNPFLSLVPEQGVKLTPKHYAYLKISEGCNHRCTFCIIPSMRGDLDSRAIGEVLGEAKRLKMPA